MKRLSLILAAFAFLLGACERHHWEDVDSNGNGVIEVNEKGTKRLYKKHGDEGEHAGGSAGEEEKKGGEEKDH